MAFVPQGIFCAQDNTMNLLALDTSTEACSLALWQDGEIHEWHERIPRQHADQILGRLTELLAVAGMTPTQLDAIAFGRGPGSFTGLRIATGVAQGLSYGLGIPLLPVSTLSALARQAYLDTDYRHIVACLDARIDEVYWAAYSIGDDASPVALCDEQLVPPENMDYASLFESGEDRAWHGVGNGWSYQSRFPTPLVTRMSQVDAEALPRASAMLGIALDMLHRGETTEPSQAVPVYLRDQVTREA